MQRKRAGVASWLVSKTGGFLDTRLSRRSFVSRTTLLGAAVAASGVPAITRRVSPYVLVTDCPAGSLCRDGYTEFCCVINNGVNACPSGTVAAGWWRADFSVFCNGTRYYIDCNNFSGAGPCRCAAGCNTRKVYCNQFRYGQCNRQIPGPGVIACRMVTCIPPYQISGLNCAPSDAVDNATANHNADCAKYAPPPPIPAPVALPVVGVLTDGAGSMTVVARGTDSAMWINQAVSGTFGTWQSLGGQHSSAAAIATYGPGNRIIGTKNVDGRFAWTFSQGGGPWSTWASLDGVIASDPVLVSTGSEVVLLVRGTNGKLYTRTWNGASWTPWVFTEGVTNSDPAAVLDAGTVLLCSRGNDREIHFNRIAGGAFQGWRGGYGGRVTADPVLVNPASGPGAVLIERGENYKLYVHGFGGASPSQWQSLPNGSFTSEGALVIVGSEQYAFGRGNYGNNIFWSHKSGGSWSPWQTLGFDARSRPVAVHDGSALYVFVLGSDQFLWYRGWTGSWDPAWTQVGGQTFALAKGYQ